MCWNQYVSINTFFFGVFVLGLIAFNNVYSTYKIDEFKNLYTYFFFLSFISMQLIETLLWRNLKNRVWNQSISIAGALLLLIQPIASLMLIKNIARRNCMVFVYSILAVIYFMYKLITHDFYTSVSKCGHLKWNWGEENLLTTAFYLFFMFYSLWMNKYYTAIFFGLLLFVISYYSYYTDGSAGSLWCWSVNIFMLYYLCKLLFVLPYREYMGWG